MRKLMSLAVAIVLVSACDKAEQQQEEEIPKITTEPAASAQGGVDGPDCPTFLAEVRQACNARLREGVDVDCHGFIMKANKQPDEQTCAQLGAELREAVAAAGTIETGPDCAALGARLDQSCFSKIGTPDYAMTCDAPLIALKRVTTDRNAKCGVQLAALK